MTDEGAPSETGRCLEHPFMPVTGSCARCGRFTCRLCPRGAGPDEPTRCSPCAWRDGVHGGALQIGGWLIVFAIMLIYKVGGAAIGLFISFFGDDVGRNQLDLAGYLMVTILIAALFVRRRRIAPTALIASSLVDLALVWPKNPSWPNNFAAQLGTLMRWSFPVLVIVGLVYLLVSKRVKRTFVLPGL